MKRILIIEDHAPMRRNLATLLEMEGYIIVTAESGRVGLDAIEASPPDLVLCDVMMPELDGHAVLRAVRADDATATLPFIFLTAKGEKPDVRAGMNLGADDYLTKPVAKADLLRAVSARLERARAHDARLEGEVAAAKRFNPDFGSPKPLEEKLGLTPREAEVLLWVAQGKSNAEISIITGAAEKTVKHHLTHVFEKLGVESRNAATFRALEVLSTGREPS